MSLNAEFKVESSFASRNKMPTRPPQLQHAAKASIGSYDSSDDDDGHKLPDTSDILPPNEIIYHSPYSDDEANDTYDLGPHLEEHYTFGNERLQQQQQHDESLTGYNDMNNSTFSSSNWAEFPEWSTYAIQQQLQPQQQLRRKFAMNSQGYDNTSQSTFSLMNTFPTPPVPSMSLNEDDPLIFLRSQESRLLASLNDLLLKHSEFLAKGHGKVNKVRNLILTHLNQLHEVHQAMNEIYNAEKSNRLGILQNFQKWEAKKALLLERINDIQSDSNEEGVRYRQLLSQSNAIDSEINELESRLKQAKQKRSVLRKELSSSQSVIESKASSYIESLNVIEHDEISVMRRLSSSNAEIGVMSLPGITFPKTASVPSTAVEFDDSRGEQPLGILDMSRSSISRFFSKNDDRHSHAAAPKLSGVLTETFKAQVDVTPVVDSLKLQIEAINDEISKQESSSFKFQEGSIIWNESIGNVSDMETAFKRRRDSRPDETQITSALEQTLELLRKRYDVAARLKLPIVKSALSNEISTIRKALYIVTNDDTYLAHHDHGRHGSEGDSGLNTPSSLSSSDKLHTHTAASKSNSSSSSSVHKTSVGAFPGAASAAAPTLANSGPPTILSANKKLAPGTAAVASAIANGGGDGSGERRKSSSVFSSLGFTNIADKANEKFVKKD